MNQYQSINYPYNRFTAYYPWQYPNVNPCQPAIEQTMSPNNSQTVRGAIVASADNITADNVPMDGSVAFFPLQDLSEIYVKKWNSDGTIKTVIFRPVAVNKTETVNDTTKTVEMTSGDLLKELSDKIDRLERSINKMKPQNPNMRKEGNA